MVGAVYYVFVIDAVINSCTMDRVYGESSGYFISSSALGLEILGWLAEQGFGCRLYFPLKF